LSRRFVKAQGKKGKKDLPMKYRISLVARANRQRYTQGRMDVTQPESERLKRDVEGALERALDPADVLPMLHRLSRTAAPGSEESVFAHRQLAELLIERHPWRATLHARRVLSALPGDDRAWAVLAASQAMLGHYRFAVTGYKRALEGSPDNPSYAHNLGHLLDVAMERPREAVPWLRSAYLAHTDSTEIAASYAHALARAGEVEEAQRILEGALRRGGSREHAALRKWIQKGAPPRKALPALRPPMLTAPTARSSWSPTRRDDQGSAGAAQGRSVERSQKHGAKAWSLSALDTALSRGLACLPVGSDQRRRASALARDVARCWPVVEDVTELQSLAAAVAYAIVYVDHVPLTQGEVAACFRVSASLLRARFKDLRLRLDLTPGDVRYATLRRS
jgi:tetratricopeptide (TPR) repeat protein